MNISSKKIINAGLVSVLFLGSLLVPQPQHTSVHAQCASGSSSGLLEGIVMTDNMGPIYMNTETWNTENPTQTTSQSFQVTYNRQTGLWNGRGHNPYVGWVDFGLMNPTLIAMQLAQLPSVADQPDAWGNMDSIIDLSSIQYYVDPGIFDGNVIHGDYTAGNTNNDVFVGMGGVDFSDILFIPNLSTCDEYIGIVLDGFNILYKDECPIDPPVIQWSGVGVVPGSCETGTGLWSSGSGTSIADTGSATTSAQITDANTPVTFQIQCVGQDSGEPVIGTAIARCGEINPEPPLEINENIDLRLNGDVVLEEDSCPIDELDISWTTTADVIPGSCRTGEGLWQSGSNVNIPDNGNELSAGSLTSSNTPLLFEVTCVQQSTGNQITSAAKASCGNNNGPGGSGGNNNGPGGSGGIIIDEFREV